MPKRRSRRATSPEHVPQAALPSLRPTTACILLLAAVAGAYADSLSVPMVFDDHLAIAENESIRRWWSLGDVLSPPSNGCAVQGRPFANLTLAINYACGGDDGLHVVGYHVVNILIHMAACLTLFDLVRRTLLLERFDEVVNRHATGLAFAVALLWGVHPLTTEAVTYIVQRTESLASLFYLLTIYLALRSALAERSERWSCGAVAACAAGMATKEIVVSAPLLVLAYDRSFLFPTWGECLRRRRNLYAALTATWLVPIALLLTGSNRGETVGLGLGVTSWEYFQIQLVNGWRYLALVVVPAPLIIDYGPATANAVTPLQAALALTGLLALIGFVSRSCRPWGGFLCLLCIAVLGPSSSFLPIVTEVTAERRMYLPSACVIVVVVCGLFALGRKARPGIARLVCGPETVGARRFALGAVAAALAVGTALRNHDYRSELDIWSDAAIKRPENPRAHFNLANELGDAGRTDEAVAHYRRTFALDPHHAKAHANLGNTLLSQGKVDEAVSELREALRIDASNPPGVYQIGELAAERYLVHYNLAGALQRKNQATEAADAYQAALRELPGFEPALNNLGTLAFLAGRTTEAAGYFRRAAEANPQSASAHGNLALALSRSGKASEAVDEYRRALEVAPADMNALCNLAWLRAACPDDALRNGSEAVELARRAVAASQGDGVEPLRVLAAALAETGALGEAARTAKQAADLAQSQNNSPLYHAVIAEFQQYLAGRPLRDTQLTPHAPGNRP